ncbi:hypothetical protein BU17DRAFT_87965 [Hysterangium stoloniferum]|nr:hypothetical protein BU17DRAFT_87965 [Hysterangium stoloniferum]
MPFSSTFKGDEFCLAFLAVYPFAAFVLDGRNKPGKEETQLHPVYANAAYLRLINGPGSVAVAQPTVPIDVALLGGLVDAFADINEERRFVAWFQPPKDSKNTALNSSPQEDNSRILSFRPSWLPSSDPPLQKTVVRTFMNGFWVCITVPLENGLTYTPVPPPTVPSLQSRRASPKLHIPNFPPPPAFPRLTSAPGMIDTHNDVPSPPQLSSSPISAGSASVAPQGSHTTGSTASNPHIPARIVIPNIFEAAESAINFPLPTSPGEMSRMIANYPWEETPLGPMSQWSQSLKTALSICIQSPMTCALMWGPCLTLVYNDGYADMAGKKHPHIFAKPAVEAWGELSDMLEPLSIAVLKGKSAARVDDLMFFDRMSSDRMSSDLPEEVYHTWSWIPVKGENGAIEGIINWSMETTQKVIAERRLLTLRAFGERAKLSKDVLQLTSALLSVLEQNKEDVPFATFYYCQTPKLIAKEEPYRGQSTNDQASLQLSLSLAGTIGVPDGHLSTPLTLDVSIDRVTLCPNLSPKGQGSSTDASVSGATHITTPASSSRSFSPSTWATATTTKSSLQRVDSVHSDSTLHSSRRTSPSPVTSLHTPSPSYLSPPSRDSISSTVSNSSTMSWRWPIAEALASRRPLLVPNLPHEVTEGLSRRSWGDLPRQAIIIPIWSFEGTSTTESALALPQAVLILGVNPRRPYDKDYEDWVDLVKTSLGVSLAAVLSWEAETQRAEQLAQLDAAKTSFFSNVSHELRTPLTLIMGPIQDALSTVQEPKIKETLKLASRNVSRLSRLVDSLMDFTRIEAGKLLGNFKPVQLGAFTADLSALFRTTIEKSHIEFTVDCDTTAPILCYVDPDLWEKIVFNLIGNAFKYTMRGSISVRLAYTDNEVKFEVEDTGVGIPLEDQPKVFQRFHRVTELVRLHSGKITVTSKTEEESLDGSHGSTFTVIIPLGKDHLPAAHVHNTMSEEHRHRHYARGIVEEATHWSRQVDIVKTPSDTSESGGSSEGGRLDASTLFFMKKDILLVGKNDMKMHVSSQLRRGIIVVDDSCDMRQFIKSMYVFFLRPCSLFDQARKSFAELCTVVEATNGQDALKAIDDGVRPTLILSDVMMPVMDGYALMKTVRERPDTKLIPLVFLTAKAGEEARVDGLLSGADDYIAKPFQGRELVARVHLQMQLGKRRAELEARFEERQREIQILSDHSPIGIVRTNAHGTVIYHNARWSELTGCTGDGDRWYAFLYILKVAVPTPPDRMESVHPDNLDAVTVLWKKALDDRTSSSLEFRWKNGVWTKGQVVPLGDDRLSWAGVLFTITDISDQRLYEASQLLHAQEREATARRKAEDAEERRKEADERRRAQELLIDVTSHELRQPVSAILNCSALVKNNLSRLRDELQNCYVRNVNLAPSQSSLDIIEEDLEALDSIYQCGLAQERIANDVLSLSRIQLQVLSIHPVEFELIPEIGRVVAIFHNELKMKHIDMHLRFGTSIKKLNIQRIRSDKSRLAQVLTNLLSNAIKFADTSSDKREIHVDVEVSFNPPREETCLPPTVDQIPEDPATIIYLYLAVKDSGPGLKPDDLTLLFKRFQQGSNSHDVFGGSGLGLFVSRKLCDLMNGRIDVDSVFGQGATFRFYIQAINSPVVPSTGNVEEPSLSEDSQMELSVARTHVEPNVKPYEQDLHRQILITEDNLINQTVLNRQLKAAGFATVLASNGQQAIDRIISFGKQQKKFDAILMDCEMPVMDGITAVREIRRMEAAGDIPSQNKIYALTGNARAGQIESARDAGMNDVFVRSLLSRGLGQCSKKVVQIKPYKLDQLLGKLRGNQ